MYLDTFLGAIGVEESMIKKIRSSLDGFADEVGSVRLGKAGGFGGSEAGNRMRTETAKASEHLTAGMQELADVLREFGINLELWQDDMSYTDDDAATQIQSIQKAQEPLAQVYQVGGSTEPVPAPTTTGGA